MIKPGIREMRRTAAFIMAFAMMSGVIGCSTDTTGRAGENEPAPVNEEAVQEPVSPEVSDNEINEPEPVSDNEVIEEEPVNEYADKHIRLTVEDPGLDVFTPSTVCLPDYRYGPSMILNEDGSIDAWFSAPGDGSREFDWITYRHSDDDGNTWTDEKVAISPSPASPDALSTCDPDVFYYEGYYYLGYTATINRRAKGLCNSVYLARSVDPAGPYEKWNGHGWGGSPVPVIYYDGVDIGWGSGEPSFVIVDDTIYVYSTKDGYSGVPDRVRVTEVRTADIRDENWPGKLEFRGYAAIRNDTAKDSNEYKYRDSDSWDVAYIEESERFVAVSTNRRFKNNSCILYFESNDGIHFDRVSELNTNVIARCHNSAIMADGLGHIKEGDPMMIGYAYAGAAGSRWGVWATRFAPVSLVYTDEIDRSDEENPNLKLSIQYRNSSSDSAPMMLSTDSLVYSKAAGTGAFRINYYWQDNYKRRHAINNSDITIIDYDPEILSVDDDNWISPKVPGVSRVIIGYDGLWREICLRVLPSAAREAKVLTGFYPMASRYEMSVIQPYVIKIRPMGMYSDNTIHELTGRDLINHGIRFECEDDNICEVRDDGTVVPLNEGETRINVTSKEGLSYSIDVHVTGEW